MEARPTTRPTRRTIIAAPLPRSRTLPLLRTPVPYRQLVVFLALVVLFASAMSLAPALLERARLTEAMFDAAMLRIEPSVLHAERGRWPRAAEMPWLASSDAGGNIVERSLTAHGVAVFLIRKRGGVALELDSALAPGGTLRWRCRVRALPGGAGAALDPLSVPAVCRP